MRASALGFGCAAVMGRVGRRDSLAALSAAYDAGITFYDTARSYGYGESEALLGEFLQGHRQSVVISTKFGIVPVHQTRIKNVVKPLARKLFSVLPSARRAVKRQIGSQFIKTDFTVTLLRESVATSLRKLRTDYIDILFMHSPPVQAVQQIDLLEAMQRLVEEGKVRRIGISSEPSVIELALSTHSAKFESLQFPCNLFDMRAADTLRNCGSDDFIKVANHPFGGLSGITTTLKVLRAFARDPNIAEELREKLQPADESTLADVVLNTIIREQDIHIVIPSMMNKTHLRSNISAVENSRLTVPELRLLRTAIAGSTPYRECPQSL